MTTVYANPSSKHLKGIKSYNERCKNHYDGLWLVLKALKRIMKRTIHIYNIRQHGWQEFFYLKRAHNSAYVFSRWLVHIGISIILLEPKKKYIYIYIICQYGWQESFYLKKADNSACVFNTWQVYIGISKILLEPYNIYIYINMPVWVAGLFLPEKGRSQCLCI